jgi:hypothetical protein
MRSTSNQQNGAMDDAEMRRLPGGTTMIRSTIRTGLFTLAAVGVAASLAMAQTQTSGRFAGGKVNGGTVSHTVTNGKHVLTLSSDFQVPDTPDPHWQVVDSRGEVFLLQRLPIKGATGIGTDRINRSITLPSYIRSVAKVQIYCAWAEALLGEASFSGPVDTE